MLLPNSNFVKFEGKALKAQFGKVTRNILSKVLFKDQNFNQFDEAGSENSENID